MPIEKLKLFLAVFCELTDYNFLWKFESDFVTEDLPKNVLIQSWLPQADILAHPKLKAFITHGGKHMDMIKFTTSGEFIVILLKK